MTILVDVNKKEIKVLVFIWKTKELNGLVIYKNKNVY